MNATPVDPASGVVYPVGLRLLDREVVVVGGGQVAHRRVAGLLEARARVTVVSPADPGWARGVFHRHHSAGSPSYAISG